MTLQSRDCQIPGGLITLFQPHGTLYHEKTNALSSLGGNRESPLSDRFSGDAVVSWNSLDFQPYFNSTASNVLYGYWSHDIGGHIGNSIDPEMYIRWMQFGAFSPIMRTHSQKEQE